MTHRRSGVLIPLFSLVSSRSWGVGEFTDLPIFSNWLRRAGQSLIQMLPVLEIPDHETSPYSALTAMALDPIYIALSEVDDFQEVGGEPRLTDDDRLALKAVRDASRVQHRAVRALKGRWLRRCHERFLRDEAGPQTPRFLRFDAFTQRESWWLDDYALFRALRGVHEQRAWWEWPEPLARRHEDALAQARTELAVEIAYRKYVQWVAAEQWDRARTGAAPVEVFGDVPFMISADSPDVWADQHEFRFDATVGVPPDAFSETGQDWGLPPWRWDVMSLNEFAWMRRRARRSAALFDGFRLDHLVGLYRTFLRPADVTVKPWFEPPDEASQLTLGERLVGIYQESGADIIAEDLGIVPDFVRASLRRLGVPGYKVLRWERRWSEPGQPFIDPAEYEEVSVATTGTHDTEPVACWWDTLAAEDRKRIVNLPSVRRHLPASSDGGVSAPAEFAPALADALIRALLGSASRFAILPIQDLFGWRDRINTPARIDESNWSWRLPWLVDTLEELEEPQSRADMLARWTREAAR
ncbi:MAG TPA: 4-alpha-glucanotransferase [Vicinamibacterales bacterium]|nr:4-alpha-glucanotransferase [Vicinamibacterales bacterium]